MQSDVPDGEAGVPSCCPIAWEEQGVGIPVPQRRRAEDSCRTRSLPGDSAFRSLVAGEAAIVLRPLAVRWHSVEAVPKPGAPGRGTIPCAAYSRSQNLE